MTSSDDRSNDLAGQFESEIDVDRDVVIVESGRGSRERRSPIAVLPLLLGVLLLLANLLVFSRVPGAFTPKSVNGAISMLLILVSVVICLSLIFLGLAARRNDSEAAARDGSARFLPSLGVSLALGLLAPLFTLWALQANKLADERYGQTYVKPCLEIYETASAIAKDNPRFRMPTTDTNEARCSVNAVLGR
jgi:hypothetical protein